MLLTFAHDEKHNLLLKTNDFIRWPGGLQSNKTENYYRTAVGHIVWKQSLPEQGPNFKRTVWSVNYKE